jgi:hypothetical protein
MLIFAAPTPSEYAINKEGTCPSPLKFEFQKLAAKVMIFGVSPRVQFF